MTTANAIRDMKKCQDQKQKLHILNISIMLDKIEYTVETTKKDRRKLYMHRLSFFLVVSIYKSMHKDGQ